MYHKFRATYDANHDTFRMEFLIVPVGGLSFLVNHDFSPLEVLTRLIEQNNYLHWKKDNDKISKNNYSEQIIFSQWTILIDINVNVNYMWWW